ncbi:MAG TPA: hypothetical protein EYP39_00125 [Ghiorsea sp.]|nr:hypothetical protein [Ghiorsea sp.]
MQNKYFRPLINKQILFLTLCLSFSPFLESHLKLVQCQSDRSQHKNRDHCWKMLKARLYELEIEKQQAEKQGLEDTKSDIGWGHQIRSYVLDASRIKDLRTGMETSNTQNFLDGDIDDFIAAKLMGMHKDGGVSDHE